MTYIDEDVKKRKSIYIVGENVNWYNQYGKQYRFLKIQVVEIPYDPTIQFLSISQKKIQKTVILNDICMLMLIVALFKIKIGNNLTTYPLTIK